MEVLSPAQTRGDYPSLQVSSRRHPLPPAPAKVRLGVNLYSSAHLLDLSTCFAISLAGNVLIVKDREDYTPD